MRNARSECVVLVHCLLTKPFIHVLFLFVSTSQKLRSENKDSSSHYNQMCDLESLEFNRVEAIYYVLGVRRSIIVAYIAVNRLFMQMQTTENSRRRRMATRNFQIG